MHIQVYPAEYKEIATMRDLFRHEVRCQIVGDSLPRRGLSVLYRIEVDGKAAGYGTIGDPHYPGMVLEFYVLPHLRPDALAVFRAFIVATGATAIRAQTNIPLQLSLLYDCAENIRAEGYLFHDALRTDLHPPGATFRRIRPEETATLFEHKSEPPGDWVVKTSAGIVATGGFLTHYNPPYGDLYMEVKESERRQGYGSFILQELKRVCYEAGYQPASRCDRDNLASRRTHERAGFTVCGRILVGTVLASSSE